jgi:hypothetical protein
MLELIDDGAARCLAPLPDRFDELFAPQLVPVHALVRQLAFHNILGGDARVVRAGHPQHIVPFRRR